MWEAFRFFQYFFLLQEHAFPFLSKQALFMRWLLKILLICDSLLKSFNVHMKSFSKAFLAIKSLSTDCFQFASLSQSSQTAIKKAAFLEFVSRVNSRWRDLYFSFHKGSVRHRWPRRLRSGCYFVLGSARRAFTVRRIGSRVASDSRWSIDTVLSSLARVAG